MRSLSKLFATSLILLAGSSLTLAQSIPTEFSKLLESTNMQFTVPPGFDIVPVRTNEDVVYNIALKSKTKKLEIRYRIIPIREVNDKSGQQRNQVYLGMFLAMGMNVSGGTTPEYQMYPEGSVREEFGADAGATSVVSCDSDFGKGYAKCLISVIHRDDIGDAYVFYLFDAPQVIQSAIMTESIYHALRFQ
jgi:hypothetical protein